MGLGRSRDGEAVLPGEPGVGVDLAPPFAAADPETRWLFALNRFGIRPGLSRIEGLLKDLGHPESGLRVLVTAGTNGKGSTTRVLAHLLQAAGLRTATYTSPHLLDVRERIRIDDQPLEEDEFRRRVAHIRPLVEKHEASWFETLTALSVLAARDHGVDMVCCETGLGGRLDATNVLPLEGLLLTTVSLDHQRILGETLPEILAEKLGLLKSGVPLYCGVNEGLRPQVFTAAVEARAPVCFLDELARWSDAPGTWDLQLRDRVVVDLPDPGTVALRRNIALAVLALSDLESPGGGRLLPEDPAAALGNLFLPGRYQRVLTRPDWIFDVAHNTQAFAGVMAAVLARPCTGRRLMLLGTMHDKELAAELAPLAAGFDAVVAAPVNLPRSRTREELAVALGNWKLDLQPWPVLPRTGATVAPSLSEALALLAGECNPDDLVLVTGSCFTVAEVLWHLGFSELDMTREAQPATAVLEAVTRT
ncbi:hypothetical protein DRQ50_00265 [bacterium]|nr:MAG: hypothetical protein DRQ50_00265 [bacterium]